MWVVVVVCQRSPDLFNIEEGSKQITNTIHFNLIGPV